MSTRAPAARLPYDDLASPTDMHDDCRAVGRRLGVGPDERLARAAARPAPSLLFDDQPREQVERDLEIPAAAAALAGALHLHLD